MTREEIHDTVATILGQDILHQLGNSGVYIILESIYKDTIRATTKFRDNQNQLGNQHFETGLGRSLLLVGCHPVTYQ